MNEYDQFGAETLTHDENGNLKQDSGFDYKFDAFDRLVRIVRRDINVTVARYRYDARNRRLSKSVTPDPDADPSSTVTIDYRWDGWHCLEERGISLATYVYETGLDELCTMDRGGETFFVHASSIMSIHAVTDLAGQVRERYRYEAYGKTAVLATDGVTVLAASAVGNPYLFQSRRAEIEENSNLYYFRNRYYSPIQGRFIHRDPQRESVWADPAEFGNGYSAFGSSPINRRDPLGLGGVGLINQRDRDLLGLGGAGPGGKITIPPPTVVPPPPPPVVVPPPVVSPSIVPVTPLVPIGGAPLGGGLIGSPYGNQRPNYRGYFDYGDGLITNYPYMMEPACSGGETGKGPQSKRGGPDVGPENPGGATGGGQGGSGNEPPRAAPSPDEDPWNLGGNPIWTANPNKNLSGVQNAFEHWKKHKNEFPELNNSTQYVKEAHNFINNPPPGTQVKIRPNGDKLFYHPPTNTFSVRAANGTPRTMFKPKNGVTYWNKVK